VEGKMVNLYKKLKDTIFLINSIQIGYILFYISTLKEIKRIKEIVNYEYKHLVNMNIIIISLIIIEIILMCWIIYLGRSNIKKLNNSQIIELNLESSNKGKLININQLILSSLIGIISYSYSYFYINLLLDFAIKLNQILLKK
jgi:hypothetical protein